MKKYLSLILALGICMSMCVFPAAAISANEAENEVLTEDEFTELLTAEMSSNEFGGLYYEGDTLVVMADDTFIPTWGESSVFVLLTNGNDPDTAGKKKRWLALILLVLMIVGATIGELPVTKEMFPDIKLDMLFSVSINTIVMAWTNLFPARKSTKFI